MMMRRIALAALFLATSALAEVPANLVVDGVPEFPQPIVEKLKPYFDYRTAAFMAWNPARPEMLIRTRFADTAQLHVVKMPGGDRKQITFYEDAVGGGGFLPKDPNTIIFAKDIGGNEFFQIYRYDVPTGDVTLLTDGKSRNGLGAATRDGKWVAYSSTKRTGNDNDIWVVQPKDPSTTKMVMQNQGGGWGASDFSRDGSKLLVGNFISANESYIYLVDVATGEKTLLTPKGSTPVSYSNPTFSADDSSIYFTSDEGSEFQQLRRMRLSDRSQEVVAKEKWDVDNFDLSDDRTKLSYVINANGSNVIKILDLTTGKELPSPPIPLAIVSGVEWHPNGKLLGFTLNHARSPADAYSYDLTTGKVTRWTESETGGLNPERNAEAKVVTVKSFDGTPISSFVYRPDAAKFPGKRPVIINIHGGPEGQSQASFLGRNNFWINELGIAMIYPNVRGSTGYGKTFLAMDNGFKREDTIKDIGSILDWIAADPSLDSSRVGVYGGSYGGYMVLGVLTNLSDRVKAGIDVVGISSFLTFLQNTSGYRRDLRRVEYGDERDAKMNEFLQKVSPMTNAAKIKVPLFVIAGFNDPRVPWTEGEQMTKTVRANGVPVWFLMAKDEGHGFAKRKNQDFQSIAMTMFWQQQLLN